ncbi:MAG TPA: septum site-determining protein MinC [Anaerolineaceae bacterium]|nr:septum site-determining protein MinC [Anaerolineaceae bacterium]
MNLQIKGVRDGLLISLVEGEWSELQAMLLQHIHERATFFKGARVALDVGNHILRAAELGGLRDKLSDYGIVLWAVLSNSPTTEQTAQMLGLATRIFTPRPDRSIRASGQPAEGENALLVQKTLRSGMRIVSPASVIIIGDVNPGAEVVAGGNVIVWGKLRGVVHAGVDGDEKAAVYALDLNPMQLRIASYIAVQPLRKGKSAPEMAHVSNGQVVAVNWDIREGGR